MEGAMGLLDLWLIMLSVLLIMLVGRAVWLRERLSFPPDWSVDEQRFANTAILAFAAAACISAAAATYAASLVPWVENFPALLPHPPQTVAGRAPAHISTWFYLFAIPVSLGVVAGVLIDPWANRRLSFRGPRDLVLRLAPLLAIGLGYYSISRSIEALSAGQ
jgi:hypothetical protein